MYSPTSGERDTQTPMGFWDTNGSPNLSQTTRPDDRVKLKESEKKDKYLDFAKKLKKLWNIKVTFILIVIGALVRVTEGLLKGLEDLEIRGRVETIQTTALLISDRIESKKLEQTCCPYLPTPPLEQGMTKGQFLSGVEHVWIQFSFS